MSKRYMTTSEVDARYFAVLAEVDAENRKVLAYERDLEQQYGVPLARCSICNGRHRNPTLGKACAYCGSVNR